MDGEEQAKEESQKMPFTRHSSMSEMRDRAKEARESMKTQSEEKDNRVDREDKLKAFFSTDNGIEALAILMVDHTPEAPYTSTYEFSANNEDAIFNEGVAKMPRYLFNLVNLETKCRVLEVMDSLRNQTKGE